MNLTGIFLRDFAELDFDLLGGPENREKAQALTPSALSTVGLRRATESHSVIIHNLSGLDIDINLSSSSFADQPEFGVRYDCVGPGLIQNSSCVSIDPSLFDSGDFQNNLELHEMTTKLRLRLSSSSTEIVGERESVSNLPISSTHGVSSTLHILRPVVQLGFQQMHGQDSGRFSPETVLTEATRSVDCSSYHAEPVVEWCMQNQRLRSNTVDLFSLEKGMDLLSSTIWSPEEEYNDDNIRLGHNRVRREDSSGELRKRSVSPNRTGTKTSIHKSNWLRPYLKNDSPEWTDMTCILRMARERVMLPDNNWMWVNDWTVDVSGNFGESTDADGWEYQEDFETFVRSRRFYKRGDSCRRRRWTRTRITKPPPIDDPNQPLKFVWATSRDENGNFRIEVKSHVTIHNSMAMPISIFLYSPSWDEEKILGTSQPGEKLHVPITMASALYLRLAKAKSKEPSSALSDFVATDRVMILPTSYNSSVWIRSHLSLGDVSETTLHFLLHIKCEKGIVDIFVEPALKVLNLLPCQLECQLGEVLRPSETRQPDSRPVISGTGKTRIANVETLKVASGKEGKCQAVDPASKPHISLRVPGYKWSAWQRIVNRKADSCTWRPSEREEDFYINSIKGDAEHGEEFKFMVYFDRIVRSGDPLVLIMSVECGLSPTVRVYAQYWILDQTDFGCHFCESFTDLMGTIPDKECSRRSHLPKEDEDNPNMKKDMNIQGHQWSIGMSGMSMYFSLREKIALSIESGAGDKRNSTATIKSKWTSPMDISNVMPKTVFSVDELGGPRRFELAISVTMCPGVFARTRMVTFIPRYEIVNLLKRELVVAQDGCLKAETLIPSQSSVPFHWERQSLAPKVRLGAPTIEEKDTREFEECWTNGSIQLDRIGITSMRLPTSGILPSKPMIVQAEVRLASKERNSAVVIVIWSANEKSNPLYLLRNRTSHTILCRQPLHDEQQESSKNEDNFLYPESCPPGISTSQREGGFECGAEFAPLVRAFLGLDRIEEFVWVLRSGDVACFGFDDPEKPHILEWSCVDSDTHDFDETCRKAFVEIDAMGSSSSLSIGLEEIHCQIGAEHSTKVIEFVEKVGLRSGRSLVGPSIRNRSIEYEAVKAQERARAATDNFADEDEDVAFSIRFNVPTLIVSVIDNVDATRHGREILLAQFDDLFASFSQSREGYHELEMRLLNLQVDNHVPSSIHPILVSYCCKSICSYHLPH